MEELEITAGESPEPNPPEPAVPAEPEPQPEPHQVVMMEAGPADELLALEDSTPGPDEDSHLKAVLEALVYVAEEPITVAQMSASLAQPVERIRLLLAELVAEYDKPDRGIQIRDVAGGYRMATKPEHHDTVRAFVKSLKPPLKLSLPALETLSVIAYKQPVTAPEIKEIRGVQGTGVLNTLLDRKLIAEAGRKNVIGKPILYKTTKEFLIQFGLKDLSELPTLKEFEEIRRMAMPESEADEPEASAVEATEPGAAGPEAPAIEAPEPAAAGPEASAVEAAEPASAEREAPTAEATEPAAAGPEASAVEAAEPAAAGPEASAVEAAEPAAAGPEAPAEPEASAVEVPEPAPVEPEAPAVEAAEPVSSEPATAPPEPEG